MYLSRLAVWYPDEVLTNADLATMVDTTDQWIVEHVGIRERRRSPADMPVHEMGARAAMLALAGVDPATVDLVVCSLSIADYHIPATANLVAAEAGCGDAPALDVRAACSSFVYALHVLRGLLATGQHRRALLVMPEAYTHVTDYKDRSTCILWGDAAFACLAEAERPAVPSLRVLDTFIGSRSAGALAVQVPVGRPFSQKGQVVQAFAIRKMAEVLGTTMERAGLRPADIAYVVGHQANQLILERAGRRAGFSPAQNLMNIETYGNCGAAGAPSVLAQHMERFRPGERVVVATVGSGLSWGGALLQAEEGRNGGEAEPVEA